MKLGTRLPILLAGLGLLALMPDARAGGASISDCPSTASQPGSAAPYEVAFRVHGEPYPAPGRQWPKQSATVKVPPGGQAGTSFERTVGFVTKVRYTAKGSNIETGEMLLGTRVCVRSITDGTAPSAVIQVITGRLAQSVPQSIGTVSVPYPEIEITDGIVREPLVPGQWQKLNYAGAMGTFDKDTWIEAKLVRSK